MPRLYTKIVFAFLASLMVLMSFGSFFEVKAQTFGGNSEGGAASDVSAPPEGSWYNQSFSQWYGKVYSPSNPAEIFGERYTAAQVQWIVYGLLSFILNATLGSSNQEIVSCLLTNTSDVDACVGILQEMVSSTTNTAQPNIGIAPPESKSILSLVFADRPLSGISYVRERLDRISIVSEVQAQNAGVGFGFEALSIVQNMWRGVRDVSFGLFVLAAIVLSFMIMFRVKISPQVVISIQSAIPKLIISLILVTFSYAIAGFLVDIMYVVIGIISVMLKPILAPDIPTESIFRLLTTGQPTVGNFNIGFFGLGVLYLALFSLFFIILLLLNLGIVGTILSAAAISLLSVVTVGILPLILILAGIVAILTVVWYLIKIFWNLLKAFAMIMILTIIAPLEIVLGVFIPTLGFNSWLKSFVSNLAVFVVTGALIFLSFIFLFQGAAIGFSETFSIETLVQFVLGGLIAPALNQNIGSASWPPLLGGGESTYMLGLLFVGVSFVIFTLIPRANEIVQSFISGKPFNYGSDITAAIGPLGMGYIGLQSSRQQGEYGAAMKTPAGPSPAQQKAQDFWSFLRTSSQGRVK